MCEECSECTETLWHQTKRKMTSSCNGVTSIGATVLIDKISNKKSTSSYIRIFHLQFSHLQDTFTLYASDWRIMFSFCCIVIAQAFAPRQPRDICCRKIKKQMSGQQSWLLSTLPIELVYRILDYLTQYNTLISATNICERLDSIVGSYQSYQVKLTSCILRFFKSKQHKIEMPKAITLHVKDGKLAVL